MTLSAMKRRLRSFEVNNNLKQNSVCVQEIVSALKELMYVISNPHCEDDERDKEALQMIGDLYAALEVFMDKLDTADFHSEASFNSLSDLHALLGRVKSAVGQRFAGNS